MSRKPSAQKLRRDVIVALRESIRLALAAEPPDHRSAAKSAAALAKIIRELERLAKPPKPTAPDVTAATVVRVMDEPTDQTSEGQN